MFTSVHGQGSASPRAVIDQVRYSDELAAIGLGEDSTPVSPRVISHDWIQVEGDSEAGQLLTEVLRLTLPPLPPNVMKCHRAWTRKIGGAEGPSYIRYEPQWPS